MNCANGITLNTNNSTHFNLIEKNNFLHIGNLCEMKLEVTNYMMILHLLLSRSKNNLV